MNKGRINLGFTLMETLIAVAIITILMGVAFIAVQNYQRTMKQLELDKTAQELLITAQNHLSEAEALGKLKGLSSKKDIGIPHDRGGTTYYYFFVSDPETDEALNSSSSVLSLMLPPFSIDARDMGSYAIEYDLTSATVTNVFYSEGRGQFSTYKFQNGDENSLLYVTPSASEGEGYLGGSETASANRLHGYNNVVSQIIGWFGGDSIGGISSTSLLMPVRVIIEDGDQLVAKVSFKTSDLLNSANSARTYGGSVRLQVRIKGLFSGNERIINGTPADRLGETISQFNVRAEDEIIDGIPCRTRSYVLDDVASANHFYSMWCSASMSSLCAGEDNLVTGEDIKACAVVSSSGAFALRQEYGYDLCNSDNSLFDKVDSGTAEISNFRHLENLDLDVSKYDLQGIYNLTYTDSDGNLQHRIPASNAKQTKGLSWSDFHPGGVSTGSIRIVPIEGSTTSLGSCYPISPSGSYAASGGSVTYLQSYNGDNHYISDVVVNSDANAGLFGTLKNCVVKDLELKNFKISTTSGAAGALAGTATGATVTNVLVHNDVADDTAYTIEGADAVGGLIGSMSGGSISNSAASVYVKATGSSASAGGLVGSVDGNAATIKNSYAGGHTDGNGQYSESTTATQRGHMNVYSTATAGGLVGTFGGTEIENCYSTCSAQGTTVGGLVGNATAGTIGKCYATGLIKGSTTAGAFVGTLGSDSTLGTDNQYYSIVNSTLDAIGSDGNNKTVTAFDESVTSFNAFATGGTALPYDATLKKNYNDKYPFKTVNTVNTVFQKNHYGDWPAMETLVVNTPTSSS